MGRSPPKSILFFTSDIDKVGKENKNVPGITETDEIGK